VSNRNELSKWRANAKSDKAAALVSDKMSLLGNAQCTMLNAQWHYGRHAGNRRIAEHVHAHPSLLPWQGRGKKEDSGGKMKKTKFWIQLMVVGSKSCNFARFLENRQ